MPLLHRTSKKGQRNDAENQRAEKSLEVIGKKGNPNQKSFASSAVDCCRAEEHLNAPRIHTNASESDVL